MRKKKNPPLFGQSIPQDCAYCYHNGGSVEEPVCTLRLPGPGGDCRSYLYDPLLREPRSRKSSSCKFSLPALESV